MTYVRRKKKYIFNKTQLNKKYHNKKRRSSDVINIYNFVRMKIPQLHKTYNFQLILSLEQVSEWINK